LKFPKYIPSPFDACLREAASAKAGGRARVAAGSESLWLGEGWTKETDSPSPPSPEGVKKLGAVERPEGYLQNCRMRALKMYGS